MRPSQNTRSLERVLSALLAAIPVSGGLWVCGVFEETQRAYAGLKDTGRWSPITATRWDSLSAGHLVSGGAVHMALLRGASDKATVMHFEQHDQARVWVADPMDTVGLGVPVPYDTYNFFCGGHATLPNGELLVVGGTVESNGRITPTTGDNRCAIFNPLNLTWRVTDSTHFGRWYPTVTALGDGTILTTAGAQWANAVMFGGVRETTTTTTFNVERFLNLRQYPNWGGYPTATRPSSRHGHTSVFRDGFAVIHGGEESGAPRATRGHSTARIRIATENGSGTS